VDLFNEDGTYKKPSLKALTKHQKLLLQKYEIDYHTATAEELLRLPPAPHVPPLINGNMEPTFSASMRGLGPNPDPIDELHPKYPLSAEQLAAVNVLLDFNDSRSQAAKLRSLGIPTVKYNNWLRNPHFQEYIRFRAEYLLNNTGHEAHVALMRNIQRGNQRSIEYYNEMIGRYNPRIQEDRNITLILVRLVEVIQRHIKDPEVLRAIAADFNDILPSDDLSNGGLSNGSLSNGNGGLSNGNGGLGNGYVGSPAAIKQ